MNINLSVLLSNAKVRYLGLLCRCCVALALCGVLLFPSIEAFSATGGGGSTRGGGAGKKYYTSSTLYVGMKKGFINLLSNGNMQVVESVSSPYYVGTLSITPNVKTTAEAVKQSGLYVLGRQFFMEFYNYNGTWTKLGSTTYLTGGLNVEVPKHTTAIKFVSLQASSIQYKKLMKADNEDQANILQPEHSKNYLGNVWTKGVGIEANGPMMEYPSVATLNYFPVETGATIGFTNTTPHSVVMNYQTYDSSFKPIGNGWFYVDSSTDYINITNSNTKYIKFFYYFDRDMYSTVPSILGVGLTITGLNYEPVAVDYQTDTSSISEQINYSEYITNVVTITNGDGSTLVIGDNNEIEIGTPAINPVPVSPVQLPNENPPDDNSGDDDKSFWDIIGDLFGGIGEALEGLLSIIMMPLNFIISAINELVGLLNSTLTATAGLGEFMTGMFGWMPQPIPALLVTFMSGLIVVAFIKFLRG